MEFFVFKSHPVLRILHKIQLCCPAFNRKKRIILYTLIQDGCHYFDKIQCWGYDLKIVRYMSFIGGIMKKSVVCTSYIVMLVSALFIGAFQANAQTQATVLSQDNQAIEGWGAFPSYFRRDWGSQWHMFSRPAIASAVLDSLGLSTLRLDIQPRFYNSVTGLLDETQLIDLKDQIKLWTVRSKTDYMISIWSPPAAFKNPAHINGTDQSGVVTNLRVDKEADYIQFIVRVLTWVKNESLPLPVALSLQNEPTYAPSYDGCTYDSIQYARVNINLRSALNSAGMQSVQLIGGEGNNYWDSFVITNELKNPATRDAISVMASHTYDIWSNSNQYHWDYASDMGKSVGKPYWMTEYCPEYTGNGVYKENASELEWTLGGTRRFLRELRHTPVVRYYFWKAYSGSTITYNAGTLLSGDQTPEWSRMARVIQAIYRNAPVGSKIRYMSTTDTQLKAGESNFIDMIGFIAPQAMTVVLVNPLSTTKSLTVNGLTGTNANVLRPTDPDTSMNKGTVTITNNSAALSLPAQSVTVLVTNAGNGQTPVNQAPVVNAGTVKTITLPSLRKQITAINNTITIALHGAYTLKLYGPNGKILGRCAGNQPTVWNVGNTSAGIYFVEVLYGSTRQMISYPVVRN